MYSPITFDNSKVVKPLKIAFSYPLQLSLTLRNHSNNPLFVFNSGPIIDVLMTRLLGSKNSPNNLDLPYSSRGSV